MTISLARSNSTNSTDGFPVRVDPADVWDLDRVSSPRRVPHGVRTLDDMNRKRELRVSGLMTARHGDADTIETRREKRAATMMGAVLGLGLVVGSVIGGAFSFDDGGYGPQPSADGQQYSNAVTSVGAAHLR